VAIEHSRGLLLAEGATGRSRSELQQALEASQIVISVGTEMPASLLTARVLLTTLRRGPGELILVRGGITATGVEDLAAAVAEVDPDRPLRVGTSPGVTGVRLHLGADVTDAIRVVPEGFGAHIAGHRGAVIRPDRPPNAVGAVYAAALAAAEAFKHTARVLPRRRKLHRHLSFCPVTLSSDLGAAPDLPPRPVFELALIGVGAIGTGIVLLLDSIGAQGRLLAVDHQRYGPENRGTYSVGGSAEARTTPWKTDIAIRALPHFDVIAFRDPVSELPAAIDSMSAPWLPLVLTALDTAQARRYAQRLWPDRLIDGATGDTMLGIHDHQHAIGPCLHCFFPPDNSGPTAAQRLADATGLSPERAMRGDDPLTSDDLAAMAPERQRMMQPFRGSPVCGLAQAIGLTELDAAGYQPSIPFVSLQAACLSIGRLIGSELGVPAVGNLVQYDALIGPRAATIEQIKPWPDCICESRRATISAVRSSRAAQQRAATSLPGTI
jgi:hypothetical protein